MLIFMVRLRVGSVYHLFLGLICRLLLTAISFLWCKAPENSPDCRQDGRKG
jgi:hypothetical protein